MTDLTFKKSGPTLTQVQLDAAPLAFNDQGEAHATIPENQYYLVQWFVRGNPGEVWSVELTSPAIAEFHFKSRLGPDGKDGNYAWIIVPA